MRFKLDYNTMMKKKFLFIAIAILVSLLGLWTTYYKDRIYQGIQVANINIGGRTKDAAQQMIAQSVGQPRQIILVWGDREWTIDGATLEWSYDPQKTTEIAYAVGRGQDTWKNIAEIWSAKQNHLILDPAFTINETKLNESISKIESEINIPAKEPEISFDKNSGTINITPGENGQATDRRLLNQRIMLAIKSINNNKIEIPVVQLSPKLSEAQIQNAKARSQNLVGKKLEIKDEINGQTWTIEDVQMLAWLDAQTNGWKEQAIDNWTAELAQTVDRPAENASFRVVGSGKVEEFKAGKEGLRVKQADMKQEITRALKSLETGQPSTQINILMEIAQPEIKTGDANNLGIRELIGRGESWFSGSIDNRIFNIKKATEAINGILVAPGETFSFNDKIGEVSAATGYKSAYIIKDGKTVLGDGGGVCQVSSTLFRAVLHAGLPIKERLAHAYRVSYYEEKSEPGFDATVFQPSPDFKFANDTSSYILIQTLFDEKNKHVVFDIYGTSDGRQVSVSKARIWESIPPPPALYQDDATKPVGYQVQIEHPAWGAKVAFDWKVTRNGETLQDRTFYSNYAPWQAVYIRGTKQ